MKRLIVYYSLSGNTEKAVKTIAEQLECDTLKIETRKPMPKSFAAQILVGGGQVAMGIVPALKPIEKNLEAYDEIMIGTPIWNSKCVPAVNAFLKDESICRKVTGLILTSGGGGTEKCLAALRDKIPNLKHTVSLLDPKLADSAQNGEKISRFIDDCR